MKWNMFNRWERMYNKHNNEERIGEWINVQSIECFFCKSPTFSTKLYDDIPVCDDCLISHYRQRNIDLEDWEEERLGLSQN